MKKNLWKFLVVGLVFMVLALGAALLLTRQQAPIIRTGEITLTIKTSPDFSLVVSPPHIDSFIDRVATSTASVTSHDEFSGDITFTVTGLPASITVTFFPSDTLTLGPGETRGVQIDYGIPDDETLVGDYTILITATSTVYN